MAEHIIEGPPGLALIRVFCRVNLWQNISQTASHGHEIVPPFWALPCYTEFFLIDLLHRGEQTTPVQTTFDTCYHEVFRQTNVPIKLTQENFADRVRIGERLSAADLESDGLDVCGVFKFTKPQPYSLAAGRIGQVFAKDINTVLART
jgi:hypothetical protein